MSDADAIWVRREIAKIAQARELLGPRPITVGTWPAWFVPGLERVERLQRVDVDPGSELLVRLYRALSSLVHEVLRCDVFEFHGLSQDARGVPLFVIEMAAADLSSGLLLSLERFGRAGEIDFALSAASWQWPGSMVRAEFGPRQQVVEVD